MNRLTGIGLPSLSQSRQAQRAVSRAVSSGPVDIKGAGPAKAAGIHAVRTRTLAARHSFSQAAKEPSAAVRAARPDKRRGAIRNPGQDNGCPFRYTMGTLAS